MKPIGPIDSRKRHLHDVHALGISWVQDVVVKALVDTGSTDVDAKIAV